MTRTNVLQTTIVQLDVIICTDKYATACAVCFEFKVLQIDVVTFFRASAETAVLQIGNIFNLRQEE